jgi:simple sugar transport system ATP-binding protein
MTTQFLMVRGLSKRYGSVTACSDVSLDVGEGEIVGLLGQNGAGKTTLMKLIAGLERPDRGSVTAVGVQLRPGQLAHARSLGIAMVHQELSLVNALTPWENVALVREGRLSRRATIDKISSLSEELGLEVTAHLDSPAGRLPLAVRQRVEILKCLIQQPRIILLDEPTAILSREEASRLFEILRRLVQGGSACVVVSSHRLAEILRSTDRVVVLRSGAVVAEMPTASASERVLARHMLGDELPDVTKDMSVLVGATAIEEPPAGGDRPPGDQRAGSGARSPGQAPVACAAEVSLEISALHAQRAGGGAALTGLTLAARRGEIVGLVGVEGNGQAELMDILGNRAAPDSGSIRVAGQQFRVADGQRLRGVAIVPADRHRHGCVLDMSVAENLVLGTLGQVSCGPLVVPARMRRLAMRLISEYGIACADPGIQLRSLSGGHQQRVVLARELSRRPVVLVADQPTRGLDIAAVADIWNRIRDAAAQGVCVLLNSSDLDEVLQLATRIVVIVGGRCAGEVEPGAVDAEGLGLLMGGASNSCAA